MSKKKRMWLDKDGRLIPRDARSSATSDTTDLKLVDVEITEVVREPRVREFEGWYDFDSDISTVVGKSVYAYESGLARHVRVRVEEIQE